MLERLSVYLQAKDRVNKKMIAALTYPAFIIIFFFAALAVMTIFLVPRFKSIYAGFGAKLPPITAVVFAISDMVVNNIVLVTIVAVVLSFLDIDIFSRQKPE
jgi:Type II secretory pathway, component PulF